MVGQEQLESSPLCQHSDNETEDETGMFRRYSRRLATNIAAASLYRTVC